MSGQNVFGSPRFAESLVVEIGEDTCEIRIASKLGVVFSRTLAVGNKKYDEIIAMHMKRAYRLEIGARTAEEIKVRIGSVLPLEQELSMEVKGRDSDSGLPKSVNISSAEIRPVLQEALAPILESIQIVIQRCPPELAAKVKEHGIILAGNGAMLRCLDILIAAKTKLPVYYEGASIKRKPAMSRPIKVRIKQLVTRIVAFLKWIPWQFKI